MNDTNRRDNDHLDDTTTAAYLDGALAGKSRDVVESHLAACGACRAGAAMLASAIALPAEPVPEEILARARGPAPSEPIARAHAAAPVRPMLRPMVTPEIATRRRVVTGLAAGMILAVAIGVVVTLSPRSAVPSAPVERGEAEEAMRAISPAAGETASAGALVFRWSAVPGADRYIVTLFEATGAVRGTFESRTAGAPLPWPPDRSPLAPATYLWSVRAMALDRAIAETRPVAFEIR